MNNIELIPHPTTPCPAIHTLTVKVERLASSSLHLQYTLHGDIAQVRIPAPKPPVFTDGLWQHTCFEAFIAVKGKTTYREFNFSPSGQWAAYGFNDYRQPNTWCLNTALNTDIFWTSEQLKLITYLPRNAFPKVRPLQLALTAVIELTDGSKSYWALKHPGEHPDFHHRDGFTHEIWS